MKHLLKKTIGPVYRAVKEYIEERQFRKRVLAQQGEIRLVVGSSGKFEPGWIPSEAHFLNLLDEHDWLRYFKEGQIDAILAEHVWEHLTLEQGQKAADTCYRFLKKGGRLRVAVPDGFHAYPEYIDMVKPGGWGAGADDHKVLYNYQTFQVLFEKSGFHVMPLEYFDESRQFRATDWDRNEGFIHRSIRYDERNHDGKPNYTSLIVDAIKK
jgi:predicted SAM-dependent methyltransferase